MINWNFTLLDIESYPNYFEVGIKDYVSKEVITFEVSEDKDERKDLLDFLQKYKGYLVSFNGVHYDNVVLAYFVKESAKLLKMKPLEFVKAMKEASNLVIEDDFERIKKYKWFKHPWTDIDLYLYWAKSLRISKKISLKSLGIQLGYPEVQELPYHHTTNLSKDEREEVKRYNSVNDLGVLDMLCKRMEADIKLRQYIQKEYGLSCWSMDAPKICSEYLLDDYCKKTFEPNYGIDFEGYKREIRRKRYTPSNWLIGDYLPPVKFKTKFFQDLYKEICRSDRSFEKIFVYKNQLTNVVVSMGVGGIHILNENEIYEARPGFLIIDEDVASLYPTLLDNHKFIRKELIIVLEKYLGLKADRIDAKRTGNKIKDTFLKLCLNGFTGIADSDVTWLYSPEHLLALRVYGQLIQLRVLEELSEIGIQVISNNTDGTTSIVPLDKLNDYHRINKDLEKEFNIIWEYAIIDKIAYKNVNNYHCIVSKKYMLDEDLNEVDVKEYKDVKRKGFFKHGKEIPLGDSVNEQVVAKALDLYYSEGISIDDSIRNPEKYGFHIYDYCKSNKIAKNYKVFHEGQQVQNLNRYYFSKSGGFLLKKKEGKENFEHINVGEGVKIFNIFQEKSWKDYDINYSHYTKKARDIINSINEKQRQTSLFDEY